MTKVGLYYSLFLKEKRDEFFAQSNRGKNVEKMIFQFDESIGGNEGIYILNKFLGAGAFGKTYLVMDTLGEMFMIKILSKGDDTFFLKYNQIFKLILTLNSPNVMKIFGKKQNSYDHSWAILSEFVHGKDLGKLIKEDRMDFQTKYKIAKCLNKGLNDFHTKGLSHQDFKPDNVMVADADGHCVIIDLDFALPIGNNIYGYGTPIFMAPERLRGEVNARLDKSDLWSLGASIFELFTGITPFDADRVILKPLAPGRKHRSIELPSPNKPKIVDNPFYIPAKKVFIPDRVNNLPYKKVKFSFIEFGLKNRLRKTKSDRVKAALDAVVNINDISVRNNFRTIFAAHLDDEFKRYNGENKNQVYDIKDLIKSYLDPNIDKRIVKDLP